MGTYAELVDEIRDDIDRGTAYDNAIHAAIWRSIKFYRATNLGFNVKRGAFTTGAQYTSLTADCIGIETLKLDLSTSWDPLISISYKELHWEDLRQSDSGRPTHYAMEGRELRLYPVPDQTYSFAMTYLYDLPEVSASASNDVANSWTTEADELIRLHATIDVLETKVKGPEALQDAQALRLREAQVLRQLQARAGRENRSGGIKPWI